MSTTLPSHVALAKQTADSLSPNQPVYAVMGNVAGDLDSIVSAMSLAQLKTLDTGDVWLPILNFPAADLVLRPEAIKLLDDNGVSRDDLLFVDSLDLQALADAGSLQLHITDHNQLASAQAGLASAVTGITDHHADSQSLNVDDQRIQVVGSACSLVADAWNASTHTLDVVGASMLASVILIDTFDLLPLDDPNTRTTQLDLDMAAWLCDEEHANLGRDAQTALHDALLEAKNDVSAFSALDNLRRDYKDFTFAFGSQDVRFGVSAVLTSASHFAALDDLASAVPKWYADQTLDVLIVMFAFKDDADNFHRQMAVYTERTDNNILAFLASLVQNPDMGQFEPLESIQTSLDMQWHEQLDLRMSRKKTTPVIQDAMESWNV